MRAFGALSIILLHVNACWRLSEGGGAGYFAMGPGRAVFTAGLLLTASRWAVPVFFMITGFLLLDPDKDISLKKNGAYIGRMLFVLLLFGYPMCLTETAFSAGLSAGAFGQAFLNLLAGNCWGHMWYLYSLIGIYLLLPLLRAFVKTAGAREQAAVLFALFFVVCLSHTLGLFGVSLTTFGLSGSLVGIFYALLGRFLGTFGRELPRRSWVILLVIGTAAMAYFEWLGFVWRAEYDAPGTVWVCLYAAALFVLLLDSPAAEKLGQKKGIRFLSKHSFCIYLLHPAVLNFLTKYLKIFPDFLPPVAGELVFFGLALAFSLAASCLLHLIPGVKKIL